jgi:hypothetical protein
MTDTEIKLWTALVVAGASLAVALVAHFSTRANQQAIEQLRDKYAEASAERNAKRDYQYEARKRLYQECGPAIFQLVELCEAAFFRVTGLAQTASEGHLEPGRGSFLRDGYYRVSTLYRLLAPSAALKMIQRRLTLVDLSLDQTIWRQYTLARQAFLAFGDEFAFARLGQPLEYKPWDKAGDQKARSNPAVYWRQGLPLGVIESAIEAILVSDREHDMRVMTYAECEAEYEKQDSRVRTNFDQIDFLIDDFHPRSRPVFWRLLVTQACLYRVLSQPNELEPLDWNISALRIPDPERAKFDWRSAQDADTNETVVYEPLIVAEQYLKQHLGPRLARITIQK